MDELTRLQLKMNDAVTERALLLTTTWVKGPTGTPYANEVLITSALVRVCGDIYFDLAEALNDRCRSNVDEVVRHRLDLRKNKTKSAEQAFVMAEKPPRRTPSDDPSLADLQATNAQIHNQTVDFLNGMVDTFSKMDEASRANGELLVDFCEFNQAIIAAIILRLMKTTRFADADESIIGLVEATGLPDMLPGAVLARFKRAIEAFLKREENALLEAAETADRVHDFHVDLHSLCIWMQDLILAVKNNTPPSPLPMPKAAALQANTHVLPRLEAKLKDIDKWLNSPTSP